MTSWKRSLIALWMAQFLAMLGMSQVLPFLPLYIQSLGVPDVAEAASWSGVIFGLGFFLAGLMAPVWGYMADRWGRKRMVVRAMTGSAIALGLMAYARNVNDLLLIRILHGGLGGFVSATTVLATTVVPERRIGFALGGLQSAAMAGLIIGPVTGGIFVDHLGFRGAILSAAFLLMVGVCLVAALIPEQETMPHEKEVSGILENLRFVLRSRSLLAVAGIQFTMQLALMMVHPIMALFLKQMDTPAHRLGTLTGLVFGVTAMTTLLSAFYLGHQGDRRGPVSILQVCLLGAAVAFIPQAFVPGVALLILCRAVLGAFVGGIQPAAQSLVARAVPARRRAGVLGIAFSASIFGSAVGPVLGGTLAAASGVRVPFLLAAAFLFLAWGLSFKYLSVSDEASPPAPALH